MRKYLTVLALIASCSAAHADFTGKNAAAATITFKNPGDCTAVVCVPIFSLFDSTGANSAAITTSGADGVSNTLSGLAAYDRMLVFNGTTWDRWQGGIKAASGAFASGSIASGAVSSGAYASGAIAAGAFAAGSGVDGWDLTQGAIADAAVTAGATGSVSAKLRSISRDIGTVATNTASAIPAGTAIIGKVGVDQTTPGTTNGVAIVGVNAATALAGNGVTGTGSQRVTIASDNSAVAGFGVGATGAAPPANASYIGALSGSTAGGLTTGLIACDSSVVYDASTSGSTELVALSGSKVVYVCGYSIIAGGTVNVKLITGTGTACATGSSSKTPAYQLTAQAGISDGAPFFRGIKTAAGGALCINASGGVAVQAIVYYAQF